MTATALPLLAVLGLVVGVAVRHVVWRLALDDPPRTLCSTCDASVSRSVSAVRPFTGRCTRCGARQYPPPFVPELLSAAGFALAGWIGGGALRVAGLCWLVALGLAAALVDAAIQRLPDVLTWPCLAGVIALSCGQALASGSASTAARTVFAGAAMAAFFFTLAVASDVGLADAKLAASLGATLGYVSWSAVAAGAAAGLCLAGLQAAATIAARRTRLSDHLALGPPLLAGTLLVLVAAGR